MGHRSEEVYAEAKNWLLVEFQNKTRDLGSFRNDWADFKKFSGTKMVPQIYIKGNRIGGYDDLKKFTRSYEESELNTGPEDQLESLLEGDSPVIEKTNFYEIVNSNKLAMFSLKENCNSCEKAKQLLLTHKSPVVKGAVANWHLTEFQDRSDPAWFHFKEFSDTMVVPQIYMLGKRIGGYDALDNVTKAGELESLLTGEFSDKRRSYSNSTSFTKLYGKSDRDLVTYPYILDSRVVKKWHVEKVE
jgi:glutaredoxin-related protein